VRPTLRSTSTRTFVAIPAAVLAEQTLSRRALHLRWVPVMAWGYLQYRLAGRYRIARAGGPPGMSQGRPERLVTTGIYAYSRNPMYLGHLVFLAGLTLVTRSPMSLAVTAGLMHWFDERARTDHARLTEMFGPPYQDYATRVPRWLPGLPTDRQPRSSRPTRYSQAPCSSGSG
jgi:protein-S-isoprenylcysteine O-methyltransferase Ste14